MDIAVTGNGTASLVSGFARGIYAAEPRTVRLAGIPITAAPSGLSVAQDVLGVGLGRRAIRFKSREAVGAKFRIAGTADRDSRAGVRVDRRAGTGDDCTGIRVNYRAGRRANHGARVRVDCRAGTGNNGAARIRVNNRAGCGVDYGTREAGLLIIRRRRIVATSAHERHRARSNHKLRKTVFHKTPFIRP